ncbi:MAG: hypothetical protein J6B95_02615 [Oscillospiraceae bacterium]|nr:hypothetical protein [Oscillospiraceae bacterium]
MQILTILIVAALVFGVCYLFDKGFEKAFRSKAQHKSGLAVRISKRYAAFGAILIALGIMSIIAGLGESTLLIVGGALVLAMGIGLVVYYATFGVFYDADSFILTTFGKKSTTYSYKDIKGQKLYIVQGGSVLVELHMTDGRAVSFQSTMEGVYPFLDIAFAGWCRQTGRRAEDCDFYDPSQHCWFPSEEDI